MSSKGTMHTHRLAILAALILCATSAHAGRNVYMPGTSCYAKYSSDETSLYRSGGMLVNMSASKGIRVECPVVLQSRTGTDLSRVLNASITVLDNNPDPGQNISCNIWVTIGHNRSNPYSGASYRRLWQYSQSSDTYTTPATYFGDAGFYWSPEVRRTDRWAEGVAWNAEGDQSRIECYLPPLSNNERSGITGYGAESE